MPEVSLIGLDADDTLWQNEQFFRLTEQRFTEFLADHAEPDHLGSRLLEAEKRNLAAYGFGIKGFVLSMIETALEVTDGRVPGAVIGRILDAGREMLAHPVELLPDVRETLEILHPDHRLVLITKGDLFDQERKLAASGLGDLFHAIEIVSDKSVATYERIFSRHGDGPVRALMAGNSLKSDVAPALQAGAWGVFVPHPLTWVFEHVDEPDNQPRYRRLEKLSHLPNLLGKIQIDENLT